MIEIQEWSRKHRSQLGHWPIETSSVLSAFLLRSDGEPYDCPSISLAVVVGRILVGRFSYRFRDFNSVFCGIVIAARYRGFGYSIPAFRACLDYLCGAGFGNASASCALANIPSVRMLDRLGFGSSVLDFRLLPREFDLNLLNGLPNSSYVFLPYPAMVYQTVTLSLLKYTEVA